MKRIRADFRDVLYIGIAILLIGALGNLRTASIAAKVAAVSSQVKGATSGHGSGQVVPALDGSAASGAKGRAQHVGADTGHRDIGPQLNDAGQLVPAVYATDPSVRFVYYRHMSKWM